MQLCTSTKAKEEAVPLLSAHEDFLQRLLQEDKILVYLVKPISCSSTGARQDEPEPAQLIAAIIIAKLQLPNKTVVSSNLLPSSFPSISLQFSLLSQIQQRVTLLVRCRK